MFSFGIIGLGAANSLLLLRMEKAGILKDATGIIFDPNFKAVNDKTYCFWANPDDEIVQDLKASIKHSWSHVVAGDKPQKFSSMNYYMVESITLYDKTRELLERHPNLKRSTEQVIEVVDQSLYIDVFTDHGTHQALKVYDSRPPQINEVIGKTVWQSFEGWKVRFDEPTFEERTMRLMDFNIPQNGFTQFMYVLPTSTTEALIEVTRFGQEMLPEELAKDLLRNYLLTYNAEYSIVEIERGVIPMSQNAEQFHSSPKVISTGSRAGKLKSTTGYAFKAMYEHAQEIVANEVLKKNTNPWFGMPSRGGGRFAFYDFLLLFILKFRPHWGKSIFTRLFAIKPSEEVFTFLDQRSTVGWELGMFTKLNKRKFIWSLIFSSFAFMLSKPQRWVPVVFSLIALGINRIAPGYGNSLGLGILIFLLFAVGIPHGALDGYSHSRKLKLPAFIVRYLSIMAMVVLLWLVSPIAGLIFFLIYSAWHFGETDLVEWQRANIGLSMLWGTLLLGIILLSHLPEVNILMGYMNIPQWPIAKDLAMSIVQMFFFFGLMMALWFRSAAWGLSLIALALGTQLPLALGFGIYFVLQHSLTGWSHLKTSENWTHSGMFVRALPFTAGAVIMFLVLFQFDRSSLWQWSSYFLIFLSALSLPHIYFMSRLYKEV
jgi:lycopene beta-cyclase